MISRVGVLIINVSDMDLAIDFYTNKVGMAIKTQELYPVVVELEHERLPIILNKVETPTQIDYPYTSQTVLGFLTTDLAATLDRLRSHGVELIYDTPQSFDGGPSSHLYGAFRDPFGNVHELLQFNDISA